MDIKDLMNQEAESRPLGKNNQEEYEEENLNIDSFTEEDVFLGKYPLDVILESIENQFNDYINNDDKVDYVDIFYDQYDNSKKELTLDGNEHMISEKLEILEDMKERFVSKMYNLFDLRLAISIIGVDDETTEEDEIELTIRKLYEFFILNAQNNFKLVFRHICENAGNITDDDQFFREVNRLIDEQSPLLKISSDDFFKYCNEDEIIELYKNSMITGNFLTKYSPKLYKNEEFRVELISYITMVQQFKEDILNGGK